MTPRIFGSSVLSVIFIALSIGNFFRDKADWIREGAVAAVLLLGLAAISAMLKEHRANRRGSLQAKFSKMARHENAR